jgi:hypothetical protein
VHGGRPSAWRHRTQRSGWARVAAQLVAPVALGLLIGGVLAYQAGSTNDAVHPVPLGAVPSPTPSFGRPSASPAAASAAAMMTHGHCGVIVAAYPTGARRLATVYQLTADDAGRVGVHMSSAVQQTATANAPGRC